MKKAVSGIIRCGDEILSFKRQEHLKAFPGYTAFPGGKLDPEDYEGDFSHPIYKGLPKELIKALVRELKEELGLDLLSLKKTPHLQNLGSAVTPDFNPYRFETHFFLIELDERPLITPEKGEIETFSWETPQEVLCRYYEGLILAVPPTITLLKALKEGELEGDLDLSLKYDPETEVPMIESIYGVKQFLPLSHTFPPANRTNCFLIGDSPSLLIDPSPKDEEEYRKLKKSISKYRVDSLFLTHHHPDHHERAPKLALELGVSILLSADTKERIEKAWGNEYFKGIDLKIIKDKDIVTKSLGVDVFAKAVPGHDEGQLGLYPSSKSWFLVGDLVQTVGTVVIGGDEGDMRKYFESLEGVIKLSPSFIIPSHGIILGGTQKLQKTLKHRKRREEDILSLLRSGHTKEEIFSFIYPELDEKLKVYAMAIIEAHLTKLKEDGPI